MAVGVVVTHAAGRKYIFAVVDGLTVWDTIAHTGFSVSHEDSRWAAQRKDRCGVQAVAGDSGRTSRLVAGGLAGPIPAAPLGMFRPGRPLGNRL